MKNIIRTIITLICFIQLGCGHQDAPEPEPVNWDEVEKKVWLFCSPGSETTNDVGLGFPNVMQYRYATGNCMRGEWGTMEGYYRSITPLIPQPIYFSEYRNVTWEYNLPEYQEVGELKEGQITITLEEWHTIPQCPECPDKSTVEGTIYPCHEYCPYPEPVDMCSLCTEFVEEHAETITIVFDIKEAYFYGDVLDIELVKKVSFDEKIVD